MTNAEQAAKIEGIVNRYNADKYVPSIALAVASGEGEVVWQGGAGDAAGRPMTADSPYFIASTTKLYTTAIIMQLRAEGRLQLDDPIVKYLQLEKLAGIHVLDGTDYTQSITIRNLLAHTSGLADYFEQKRSNGKTLIGEIVQEQDRGWTFDDVLNMVKTELKPKFAPSTPGKAFYSDTNYQLLGAIIESINGAPYEQSLQQRILTPLNLASTYMFTAENLDKYSAVATMCYGAKPLTIPKAMASFRADGGLVSTANDGVVFLKAFVQGKLFPEEYIAEMAHWNKIFFPLEYGVGIMRFKLPRFFTGFRDVPEVIGHSGASGTVLYYCPKLDLYISGTVNQVQKQSLSYRMMLKLLSLFI